MIRLWLLVQGDAGKASVIMTGDQMQREGVHPLRCIYLGSFDSTLAPDALDKARKAAATPPELVMARNVRRACDSGQTKRWRLGEKELIALRSGQHVQIKDRIGAFTVGYTRD